MKSSVWAQFSVHYLTQLTEGQPCWTHIRFTYCNVSFVKWYIHCRLHEVHNILVGCSWSFIGMYWLASCVSFMFVSSLSPVKIDWSILTETWRHEEKGFCGGCNWKLTGEWGVCLSHKQTNTLWIFARDQFYTFTVLLPIKVLMDERSQELVLKSF